MSSKPLLYRLEFDGFKLEFELEIQRSVRITDEISDSMEIHPFAVVDVRFRMGDASGRVLSSADPGNFLEDLSSIAVQLESIPLGADLEGVILSGAWCAWMRGYWGRLGDDCSSPDDEAIYDRLIKYSLFESGDAHVAAYLYHGQPIIEFSTRGDDADLNMRSWSLFDAIACASDLRGIASDMRRAILEARDPSVDSAP